MLESEILNFKLQLLDLYKASLIRSQHLPMASFLCSLGSLFLGLQMMTTPWTFYHLYKPLSQVGARMFPLYNLFTLFKDTHQTPYLNSSMQAYPLLLMHLTSQSISAYSILLLEISIQMVTYAFVPREPSFLTSWGYLQTLLASTFSAYTLIVYRSFSTGTLLEADCYSLQHIVQFSKLLQLCLTF